MENKDCISVTTRRPSSDIAPSFAHHHHRVSITFEPTVTTSRIRLETPYACRNLPPTTNFDFEALKSEQARLNTFNSPDCPWPVAFMISPEACAKAGFFFLRDGDKVQCAFCKGVAGEWEEGDVPLTEHKKHFPRCPFVCNLPVGNIPINPDNEEQAVSRLHEEPLESYGFDVCGPFEAFGSRGISWSPEEVHVRGAYPLNSAEDDVATSLAIKTGSGPARKHLVTVESRLKTFAEWPKTTGQSPDKMADAGFFYIGTRDHVKCFYCDGGLRNWEECDDPWFEHARWFANCPYILLNKGQDYIKQVKESKPPAPISTEPKSSISSESDDESIASSNSQSERKDSKPNIDSESPTPSTSSENENSESSDDDVIISSPHSIAVKLVKDSRKVAECQLPSPVCASLEVKSPASGAAEEEDMAEELRKLKEARQCKICMDNEVGVVFLPCGHLVSCVRCATALSHCALCRQPIKAVVRTYLS